jgi:tight adherence protein B
MVAVIVSLLAAGSVLVAAALLWGARSSLRGARSAEIARRIGPVDLMPKLVSARQSDALATALGPLGAWLHALRGRAGRGGSATAVVVPVLAFATVGVVALLWAGLGLGAVGGVLAGGIPVWKLLWDADVRARKVAEQLPDALDLIARAMRAGHAWVDALGRASEEIPAPLGLELGLVAEEHRLGIELRPCLESLLRRVPTSFELRLLVGAVLLNRETGGNLIEILDHLSETVRDRLVFESKVRALTAEVRASAAILAVLPFASAILLTWVQPDYLLPLLSPGLGRSLLMGGLASMGVGLLLMRRVARVEL